MLADFVAVKAHGTLAEQCVKCLYKGSKIAVEGDLETFPDPDSTQRNRRSLPSPSPVWTFGRCPPFSWAEERTC